MGAPTTMEVVGSSWTAFSLSCQLLQTFFTSSHLLLTEMHAQHVWTAGIIQNAACTSTPPSATPEQVTSPVWCLQRRRSVSGSGRRALARKKRTALLELLDQVRMD